jgi:hypothetical protein
LGPSKQKQNFWLLETNSNVSKVSTETFVE